jgi:peptidoglycan/xylan/chitin deacetylase (PgdA/CDA1 family)
MEKQVFFYGVCRYLGLMSIGRWLIRRSGNHVIILNYHRASERDLRRHLLYFRRHYRIMHLEDALEELYAPGKSQKAARDKRSPLVLTFDDGYRDNYTCAFELAKELHVPFTLFLVPGYIESERRFWWLEGEELVKHARVETLTIDECVYHLAQQGDREALARIIYERSYHAKSVAEREDFLSNIREALAVSPEHVRDSECVITWAEISQMQESGWVSFGAHTLHHPVLAELSDPAEVSAEICDCQIPLQQNLDHPIRTFAYPLGRNEHIGEEALRAVQKAGYNWAVTTIPGINTSESQPLFLRRIGVCAHWHWLLLAARISGLAQLVEPLFPYGRAILAASNRLKVSLWISIVRSWKLARQKS